MQIIDSTFNLNGNMQIYGDQATVSGCNIQMNPPAGADAYAMEFKAKQDYTLY